MEKIIIIKTLKELEPLKAYIRNADYIAFDTETNGLDKTSMIIGFSVSADTETGYYVILSYWDTERQELVDLETKKGAKEVLEELLGKNLIMHNAGFDCFMVQNNFGVDLMPSVHTDTMILGHVLNENRQNGLKELGVALFGEDARREQIEMKESVTKNGGQLTKQHYELFKADADLLARYGAKDTILTFKVFETFIPEVFDQNLKEFFYDDESMPLLRGPTYDMNTTGLKVDPERLTKLKKTLEADCLEAQAFIHKEIQAHIEEKYPGTSKANTFNIGSSQQLSWLLFIKLDNEFNTLTKGGKALCKALGMKLPYTKGAKQDFLRTVESHFSRVWAPAAMNYKTGKMSRPKKVGEPWTYLSCGKESLGMYSKKYKWVERFLEYAKNKKLLNTYVMGIESRMTYNIIRPSFLQHGTTSGRYSCKNPNFQNLPRDDKRVKHCIISRPGKVFVGADYSQLEPRVFASFSGDHRLIDCFKKGEDFYSVIGAEVYDKRDCSLFKNDPDSFAKQFADLRQDSKVIALSATYGTTAPKMAPLLKKSIHEAQEVIDRYFEEFPDVQKFMLESHEQVKKEGRVFNLFGRPRRMPDAMKIGKLFGKTPHAELPYEIRKMLNLAVNHRIQSTGASIMNRAAIACWKKCRALECEDPRWAEVKIVMQVHDELILEGPEALSQQMTHVLKDAMENTVKLPGVDLIAEPKVGHSLDELK